ncbi:DUF4157 domain-containing protein [Streptomyces griseoruber]|uniref:DUF4157 domain-containing protein n=1 Tax=Streptomyces griseoruber TaxID=1943 RepID=UPI0037AAB934
MRADLSAMRVHTGPAADRLARGPGAEAFAGGSHVFFRRGAYRPHSPSGFRLAGPRSRPPRPAGPWRGRRSQARRMDRQRARRPLGAGGRPLGRGELVRRLMPELGLAPCPPRPRRFNLTQAAAGRVRTSSAATSPRMRPGKSSSVTLPISPPGKAGRISQRSIDCCTREVFGYAMDDHYRNSLPHPPPSLRGRHQRRPRPPHQHLTDPPVRKGGRPPSSGRR